MTVRPVNRGFTLLEMVVAIAIFAIIAAISYSALNNFLDARSHINQENEDLRALQTMFTLLEHDLRYAVNRPVRDEYGDSQPAFIGGAIQPPAAGERLRLTTIRPSPAGRGLHQVTRVAWRVNDGEVHRVSWPVLDRDVGSGEYRRRLMTNVDEIAFRYLGLVEGGELNSGGEWLDGSKLPGGVEVTVIPRNGPAYQRLFQVSDRQ
jgi:general secretion pathway protein J